MRDSGTESPFLWDRTGSGTGHTAHSTHNWTKWIGHGTTLRHHTTVAAPSPISFLFNYLPLLQLLIQCWETDLARHHSFFGSHETFRAPFPTNTRPASYLETRAALNNTLGRLINAYRASWLPLLPPWTSRTLVVVSATRSHAHCQTTCPSLSTTAVAVPSSWFQRRKCMMDGKVS